MRLTGIIEQTFRGQIIFRGFATLRHLANISQPSYSQRKVDNERLEEICSYLKDSQFLFFPELIFNWALEDLGVIEKICNNARGSVLSNDGIKFTKALFKLPEVNYVIGDNPTKKDLTIEIPDEVIKNKPLRRIDGNHRLSAIEELIKRGESSNIQDQIVPYSILLQSKNDEAEQYEAAYFYIINSKAKALTLEENYHAIFSTDFSESQIMNLLSLSEIELSSIRQIKSFIEQHPLYLSPSFNDTIYTFCITLIKLDKGKYSATDIITALLIIDDQYRNSQSQLSNQNAFLSIVLYYLRHKGEYIKYYSWLKAGNIKNFSGATPEDLVDMYEELCAEKSYKVFVAMPYVSSKRVNDFNKLFEEICDALSTEFHKKIKLIPIMRARGDSKRIDQRLIENIKDCDIFIADITDNNDNVIFEVGLAQGCDKPTILIRANPDNEIQKEHNEDVKSLFDECDLRLPKNVPFDMDKLQYIPYSLTGYYNDIKGIMKRNIKEILITNLNLQPVEK